MVSLRKISDAFDDRTDESKIDWNAEWGDWLETIYDPDATEYPYDRLEDREL